MCWNLWKYMEAVMNNYAVGGRELEWEREKTLTELNGFLEGGVFNGEGRRLK
jgi:hypothetical protein